MNVCIELGQNSELLGWNWKAYLMLSQTTKVYIVLRL